jgi:3D (Asp-Asp-Asp) domain-containing protein
MSETPNRYSESDGQSRFEPPEEGEAEAKSVRAHRIGAEDPEIEPEDLARRVAVAKSEGRVLGVFRNTYYHFPNEADYSGDPTPLFNSECRVIKNVPKEFHDSVCVQGSGLLTSGVTVSFAKRDCGCAAVCPKTNQRICFDALPKDEFPWGRGAAGKAIVPLLTVAVDTDVIPLHTLIYIPEYDGVPRDASRSSVHDGCFIAEDRGLRVDGQHVDIFTGQTATTNLWNKLIPSNQGVTVILDSPRCKR